MDKKEHLFSEFPPVSTKEWEQKIKEDLKGADYKKNLQWQTGEGISPLPFYRREDLAYQRAPLLSSKKDDEFSNRWQRVEPIFETDPKQANRAARKALSHGAGSLQFNLQVRRTEGMLGGDLEGINIQQQEDFAALVNQISLSETPLHFNTGMASPALLAMYWNHIQEKQYDTHQARATFNYDPFVFLLGKGHYPKPADELKKVITELFRFSQQHLPVVRPLAADGRFYHHCGATIVQELGYVLATASEYFAQLTKAGFQADEINNALQLHFAIGSNYFLEIAKFRAARLLWKNLLKAFSGNSAHTPSIHGETSQWNKTLYDPYTNMLRTSTEGMSAAIAGCDAITILPFDEHFRQPDKFSRRIARNQQILLQEEAYIDRVVDPAAGSYYIETLTEEIAREAWKIFQQVEAEGGLFKAIENGSVQTEIQASQDQRDQTIAQGGRVFVGTNKFTNSEETMNDAVDSSRPTHSLKDTGYNFSTDKKRSLTENLAKAFASGAALGDIVSSLFEYKKHLFRSIAPYRGPKPFEELRLATEKKDKTPTVLNLPLGDKKMRKARATFSTNFFGCAGYEINDPIGFESIDEAWEAIQQQKPDIIVLCSSDKEYQKLVPELGEKLNQLEDKPITVLAGYPKERVESYKKAGIDEFIHSKCNVLETLQRFQKKLKIIKK